MSFGGRFGHVAGRLGFRRLAALSGALPFREAALRFFLDLKTIHASVRFALAKTVDATVRFALKKTVDGQLRFQLYVQAYKDVATRVQFYLTGGPGSGQIFYLSNEKANYSLPFGTQNAVFSAGVGSNSGSPYEDRALRLHRGTSQAEIQVSATGVGTKNLYPARFAFGPLAAQHVSAGSWVYAIAAGSGNLSNADSSPQIYIWRPSTATVIARIRNSTTTLAAGANTNDVETGFVRTLNVSNGGGGPAFDTLDGDYLVIEPWWSGTQGTVGTRTREIWFGGTTEVVDGSSPTNAASYLKAPQSLLFLNPAEASLLFKLLGSNIKDAPLRFRLQTFKNAGLRFHLRYPTNYRDAHLLVWIRQGGYFPAQLRLNLKHYVYQETVVRLHLQPGDIYRDAALRTVFRPLAYQDPALRVNLPNFTYRDAALHFAIQAATSFQNAGLRLMLPTIAASEPTVRFQLEDPGWQGLALLDHANPNGPPKWFIGDGF